MSQGSTVEACYDSKSRLREKGAEHMRNDHSIQHGRTVEWWKLPLSQLCAASLQNSDRIQFTTPPPKHKKHSCSFHNVSLSIRTDEELLQTHDSYVKFDLPSINDWPSNFLENYPQGFYRASFLNFSPGTSSSPVTLPCMYVHGPDSSKNSRVQNSSLCSFIQQYSVATTGFPSKNSPCSQGHKMSLY